MIAGYDFCCIPSRKPEGVATMSYTMALSSQFRQWFASPALRVSIHIDHGVPGSHLFWEIANGGDEPVALTRLVVHGKSGDTERRLGIAHVLQPNDQLVLPTDVDWSLLSADWVAVGAADGRLYKAPRREFDAVRDQLRETIERRRSPLSARDFLFGAADMAFGVVILGLGFFMLMWAIATG